MNPKIEVKNVTKRFRNFVVLHNISMRMSGGHIYGIMGRNGSGKTVFMKCICGFMPVDSGTIIVNGKVISQRNIISDEIGAIIETPGFLPYLSGFENLKTLAMFRGKIKDSKIRQMMLDLGLDPESRKRVRKYSLGMKQKLGIIQALMEDPPILVLDEPMNSLDFESVRRVKNMLLQKREEGKLVLIASHVRDDFDGMCDEIYEMADGSMDNKNEPLH